MATHIKDTSTHPPVAHTHRLVKWLARALCVSGAAALAAVATGSVGAQTTEPSGPIHGPVGVPREPGVRGQNTDPSQALPARATLGCSDAPVAPMANSGIAGSARLCIDDASVRAEMQATNLAADNAYTIWFVYFDRRAACQTTPCTGADALGDDPTGVFGRMDAAVADATGTLGFTGNLRDLRLSSGSEVWLLMFGHGVANPEDNRARARQLLTPQSPRLGAPAAGAAADGEVGSGVARAVFDLP
jgi:hypothetical protein